MLPRERFDKTHGGLITFNDVFNLLRGYIQQLSHDAECNIANILRNPDNLQTYFTSLYASEITAKYEKQVKYLPIFHNAAM